MKQTPGLHRLRRARVRKAESTAASRDAERRGKVRCADRRSHNGRGGSGAAQASRRTPTIAFRSSTRPVADRVSDLVVHLAARLRRSRPTRRRRKKLADFLRWALTDGQKDAAALDYAPLPASLVARLMRAHRFHRAGVTPSDRWRRRRTRSRRRRDAEASDDSNRGLGDRRPAVPLDHDGVRAGHSGAAPALIAVEVFAAGWPALQQVRLWLSHVERLGCRQRQVRRGAGDLRHDRLVDRSR